MAEKLIIDKKDKILVVAPHPDDESIGCGALLRKYGRQIDVVILTDGSHGNPEWSEKKTASVRKSELHSAMRIAGINKLYYLNLKDGEVKKYKNCLNHFNLSRYQYVFVPNRDDNHPDHKSAFWCVWRAILKQRLHICVCEYEVWTPLPACTHFLPFEFGEKEKLISCYQCQLRHINYIDVMAGIGMYRGGILHNEKFRYAEVYRIRKWKI